MLSLKLCRGKAGDALPVCHRQVDLSWTSPGRACILHTCVRTGVQVQQDKVDILVELTGHTAHNQLGCMALQPAPVQVTWIGYPNSTGLQAVDYRLTGEACHHQDAPEQPHAGHRPAGCCFLPVKHLERLQPPLGSPGVGHCQGCSGPAQRIGSVHCCCQRAPSSCICPAKWSTCAAMASRCQWHGSRFNAYVAGSDALLPVQIPSATPRTPRRPLLRSCYVCQAASCATPQQMVGCAVDLGPG